MELEVSYRIHKRFPLVSPLSQMRPVHILPSHLFEIQFYIILPSALFVPRFHFSSQRSLVSAVVFHSVTAVKINEPVYRIWALLFVYCKLWSSCLWGSSSGSVRLLVFGLMLLFRLVYPRNCGWCDSLSPSDAMRRSRGLQWLHTEAVLNVICSVGRITVSIFQGIAGALQQLLRVSWTRSQIVWTRR